MLTPSNLRALADILENKMGYDQKLVDKFVTANLKKWLKNHNENNAQLVRQNGNIRLDRNELTHIQNKKKILAIRDYRLRTGVDLITAKNQVEQWMSDNLGFKHFDATLPSYS